MYTSRKQSTLYGVPVPGRRYQKKLRFMLWLQMTIGTDFFGIARSHFQPANFFRKFSGVSTVASHA